MKPASTILFEEHFNGEVLFKSQQDLVNQLLNDPETPYYIDVSESGQYLKAQNRLKTYVSQLLSNSVTRNITEDFKNGLLILLKKRLQVADNSQIHKIVESILEPLRQKNILSSKVEHRHHTSDQFFTDLDKAYYIALITSKPLEIEVPSDQSNFTIRKFLFEDLIDQLQNTNKDLKFYRFNFPLDSYAHLFWRGLKRILSNYIRTHQSADFYTSLYNKFTIKTETLNKLLDKAHLNEDDINSLVGEILNLLNRNRFIMTFSSNAPIFGLPVIALNPAEQKNIKVYTLLNETSEGVTVHKYNDYDALLWRLFVWDKLKSKLFAGEEVKYSEAM